MSTTKASTKRFSNETITMYGDGIGLFYHDDLDKNGLHRIKTILEKKYKVICFGEYIVPAGISKIKRGVQFYDDCACIFWIVTQGGIKDEAFAKYYLDVFRDRSIKDARRNFISLLSKEALQCGLELPPEDAAYEPLRENDKFMEQVAKTCEHIQNLFLQ